MTVVPVSPPVASTDFVPGKKKIPGWDGKDSLCEVYFETCKRLGCTANSEVVRQLVRRARLLAPLPTWRVAGKSRLEMLHMAFDHMDLDRSGTLSVSELVGFARGLHPIKVHGDVRVMLRQMDSDGDRVISRDEFVRAMRPISDSLVIEEFTQGILETLSSKPPLGDFETRESKLAVVFRHLDVDGSNSLDVDELIAIFMDDAEPDPALARKNAKAQLDWLDTDSNGVVSQPEFVQATNFMYAYMTDEDFHNQCAEMVNTKTHAYDFSRAFLGPKGAEAVLPALALDKTFTHLSLRGCGLRNAGCALISEALRGHPTLRYLDIGDNPVSAGGARELAVLVSDTKSIRDLRFDGTHFTRGFSDVSSIDLELDETRVTAELLRAALARNRLPPTPNSVEQISNMDFPKFLYTRRHEVKKLFLSIAGETGKVSFRELEEGLGTLSEEWSRVSEHLKKFINPRRVFGLEDGTETADLDGDGMLSYAEFTRALHTEGTRVAVLGACVQRRVQLKVIFYALAGESGRLTLGELANGVERVLLEQADDHWGFSVEEMRGVINAEVFRDASTDEILDHEHGTDNALSWGEFYARLVGLAERG